MKLDEVPRHLEEKTSSKGGWKLFILTCLRLISKRRRKQINIAEDALKIQDAILRERSDRQLSCVSLGTGSAKRPKATAPTEKDTVSGRRPLEGTGREKNWSGRPARRASEFFW